MIALIEFFVLLFATVGLFTLAWRILRSGWGYVAKGIGCIAVIVLWWAMINQPFSGRWGGDHGVLTDMIATFGIMIGATWGLRRVGNDRRRQAAVVGGTLVLLALMWIPRVLSGTFTLPPVPSAPATSVPSPAPARDAGPRHHHAGGLLDCDALSYEGKQKAGCP